MKMSKLEANIAIMKGGCLMAKKGKSSSANRKGKPSISNDQLGENAGEGRFEKAINSKDGKCR
jgi:hypothetical protein